MHLRTAVFSSFMALALLCSVGCAVKPSYAPVSEASLRKLEMQVKSPEELGITQKGGKISYPSKVEGEPTATVNLAVNSVIPTFRCWLSGSKEPTALMFDTGAQLSLIEADTAIKHGIGIIDPKTTNITVMGVLGKEKMFGGIFSPIDFGRTQITKQLCLVRLHRNETRTLGPFLKERIGMDLLGFDLARQWCKFVTVDYPANKLTFGFNADFKQPPKGPGVWKIPLIFEGGLPHIVLEANGVKWLALVDTGSAFGVEIDESLAAELDLLKSAKPVQSGLINTAIGGMSDAFEAGVRIVNVDQLYGLGPTHRNAEIAISGGGARVGSFFFRDYRTTFDLKNQTLWLER
jgi:hypothetical protein